MQRKGRKGYATYRVVVQDSRYTPTSGKVIAYLGSYNPHSKETILDKDRVAYYLEHGAQPTDRAIGIFKAEKVKLPSWVSDVKIKSRKVKNPDKRRSTAPKEAAQEPSKEEKATQAEPVTEPDTSMAGQSE